MPGSTSGSQSTRATWVVVGLLLAVAIVLPLLVNIYDREEPTLIGFPFYYWFQFLLVPVAAVLTFIAFKLSQSATARDRRARGQSRRDDDRPGDLR